MPKTACLNGQPPGLPPRWRADHRCAARGARAGGSHPRHRRPACRPENWLKGWRPIVRNGRNPGEAGMIAGLIAAAVLVAVRRVGCNPSRNSSRARRKPRAAHTTHQGRVDTARGGHRRVSFGSTVRGLPDHHAVAPRPSNGPVSTPSWWTQLGSCAVAQALDLRSWTQDQCGDFKFGVH